MLRSADRGVSSVIAVVFMVAVTVILAAAVGAFVLDVGTTTQEPTPQVANADAEFRVTGGTDQFVRITHRGGDTVDVSDIEIVVSFSEHPERSRLVGAPTATIDSDDFEGDDVWDGSYDGIGGALASNEPAGSDGEWSSGETLEFRIASGDVDVNPGEIVSVTVVHEPSRNVLLERELTASTDRLHPVSELTDGNGAPPVSDADGSVGDDALTLEVRDPSTTGAVAFADREQSPETRQSHASTAAASRSCAVAYETVAG